jgi:hypothetical protein
MTKPKETLLGTVCVVKDTKILPILTTFNN